MKFQNATPVSPNAIRPFRFQSGCVVFDQESGERYRRTFFLELRVRICLKSILGTQILATESGDKLYICNLIPRVIQNSHLREISIIIKFYRHEMHSIFVRAREMCIVNWQI